MIQLPSSAARDTSSSQLLDVGAHLGPLVGQLVGLVGDERGDQEPEQDAHAEEPEVGQRRCRAARGMPCGVQPGDDRVEEEHDGAGQDQRREDHPEPPGDETDEREGRGHAEQRPGHPAGDGGSAPTSAARYRDAPLRIGGLVGSSSAEARTLADHGRPHGTAGVGWASVPRIVLAGVVLFVALTVIGWVVGTILSVLRGPAGGRSGRRRDLGRGGLGPALSALSCGRRAPRPPPPRCRRPCRPGPGPRRSARRARRPRDAGRRAASCTVQVEHLADDGDHRHAEARAASSATPPTTLPSKDCVVEEALAGDHQVGALEPVVELELVGHERRSPSTQLGADRGEPAGEPAGGTGARERRDVDAVVLPVHLRPGARAGGASSSTWAG